MLFPNIVTPTRHTVFSSLSSIIATVEKQSVCMHLGMHLEAKEELTPWHEPKVILDDIIRATVEKQSAVMKAEFTPGHEPKVMILDDIIRAIVEKQSADMKEESTPWHELKVIRDDSIIATVEKQSVCMHLGMHLEAKEELTPWHAPKVILDDIINATVEKQSAGM